MTSPETCLELALHSGTPAAFRGALQGLSASRVTYASPYLATSTGRMDGTTGALLWKKGKVKAAAATLVALTCDDPDLLSQMAARETRQGVLTSLIENPALPLEGTLEAYAKISGVYSYRSYVTKKVREYPLTPQLHLLALTHQEVIGQSYAHHSAHTTSSLLELVAVEPDSAPWASLVLTRPDLLSHLEVLNEIVSLASERAYLAERLASRQDVKDFPWEVFVALAGMGPVATLVKAPGLSMAHLEVLVRSLPVSPGRSRRTRSTFYRALALRADVPLEMLRNIPLQPDGIPALAALLRRTHPDNQSAWEFAGTFFESFQGRTTGDLLEAIEALLT